MLQIDMVKKSDWINSKIPMSYTQKNQDGPLYISRTQYKQNGKGRKYKVMLSTVEALF